MLFVLGAYRSAVHARWIGADGKQAITAVATDNEPAFWTGGDSLERVESVNEELPEGVGHLDAAVRMVPRV